MQKNIFEDIGKDQENRFLTVNVYQIGTVMVQGSEAAISSFLQDFPTLGKIVETKKDRTSRAPGPDPSNRSILPAACLRPPKP